MRKRATLYSLCATAMAMCGLVLGAVPASASINDSPGYNHLRNEASGKCIDASYPDANHATDFAQQWRCLNTFFEEWQLRDQLNNNWEIVNHATGECLTQEASHANGTPVVLAPCAQLPSQTWHRTILGYDRDNLQMNTFLNLSSGQCLDLENGDASDGVPMQVWACNPNTNNQRWTPAR